MARVIVLEPSKVGHQHITLIEGYLNALASLALREAGHELVYRADPTSHAALSEGVRSQIDFEPIAAINPEERRFVAKGLQEVRDVWRSIARMERSDVLIVTCVTAPALLILEALSWAIGNRNVYVILHGEVEGLFDPELSRSPVSYGFWISLWSKMRRKTSPLRIGVIAGFIRPAVARALAGRLPPDSIAVLPFPIAEIDGHGHAKGPHCAIFIGYRSRLKGYPVFERLASELSGPDLRFETIGEGACQTVPGGTREPFAAPVDFGNAVSRASVAVFPYEGGYVACLSAAAIDALSAGVHVLATPRPCFIALAEIFGTEAVTICENEAAMRAALADRAFLDRVRAGSAARREALETSPFGPEAARAAFAELLGADGIAVPFPNRESRAVT